MIDPNAGTQTVIYRDKDMSVDYTFDWAPDSQWVAVASKKAGQMDIYALNVYAAQGATPMQPLQLTGSAGDNYLPQWQPNP